jgi:precorrin-6B methylase 2
MGVRFPRSAAKERDTHAAATSSPLELTRLLDAIRELSHLSWAFATTCAVAESPALEPLLTAFNPAVVSKRAGLSPSLVRSMSEVMACAGLVSRRRPSDAVRKSFHALLHGPAMTFLQAELRLTSLHTSHLLDLARRGRFTGDTWTTAPRELMQAQGIVSAAATEFVIGATFPRVEGLLECLRRPGATFLDVGAGACGATIAIARKFPRLRVIAVEPNATAVRLARRNLRDASVQERVTILKGRADDLRLRHGVDVAYIAEPFLCDTALQHAFRRVHAALRPGGILLTTASVPDADLLATAVSNLRRDLMGGRARSQEAVFDRLRRARYVHIEAFPGPTGLLSIVGRTPT